MDLQQLQVETDRLYRLALSDASKKASALNADRESLGKVLQACEADVDVRRCVRDAYALKIAELRAGLPRETRDPTKVSVGPVALLCPSLEGAWSITYLQPGALAVISTPRGSRVLDSLVRASGERYGALTSEGELSLFGKRGEYRLNLPDGRMIPCTMDEPDRP
ncbi:hypothetical protein SNE35_17545 [Paucibacter sp. R3-3]|uniref:C-type lysozyme inhibitor domain-containing protein n=1 Tax=Roseateles agri TaxID=3098619 RepID=A0ABU5DJ52_9BURK|nr:hypothetical protein [Paucibacter sp. R3-3]MDY0746320.1 hypothetical protein [Paucibacter sp. R3-3]